MIILGLLLALIPYAYTLSWMPPEAMLLLFASVVGFGEVIFGFWWKLQYKGLRVNNIAAILFGVVYIVVCMIRIAIGTL